VAWKETTDTIEEETRETRVHVLVHDVRPPFLEGDALSSDCGSGCSGAKRECDVTGVSGAYGSAEECDPVLGTGRIGDRE